MAMSFGTRPTTSIRIVISFGCSGGLLVLVNKPDLVFGLSNTFLFMGIVFEPFKVF